MDISGHDLGLLASLSVMLDERNVTRAAARLGISQPALSAQLARLRDIFGDPLLTPAVSGKGMMLTARASLLRDPLRLALQRVQDVVNRQPVFDPGASDRVFAVAANDNASAIVGARLVELIRAAGPAGLRIAFRGIDRARLPGQLESGEIDVALVSTSAVSGHMRHTVLLEDEFRMAQRKGHPRGRLAPTLEEYAALDHVLVSGDGGGFHGFMDDCLQARGFTRRVSVSVQYYSVVPVLLQTTDLVAALPARFLSRYAKVLTSLALPLDAGRFALSAMWHPRFDHDPGHVWLRQQLAAATA